MSTLHNDLVTFTHLMNEFPSMKDPFPLKVKQQCVTRATVIVTFWLYVGDEGLDVSPFGKTRDLVMGLMAPFADGYSLYMDNFYTSPYLFFNLNKLGIKATGTSSPRKGYISSLFCTIVVFCIIGKSVLL